MSRTHPNAVPVLVSRTAGNSVGPGKIKTVRVLVRALVGVVALSVAGCTPVDGGPTQLPQSPSASTTVNPYRAGHGRLVVDAVSLDYFTYGPLLELSPEESREREVVVPKGDYVVAVYLTDQTSYVANVTVAGNMETTTVTPASDPRPYEKIIADMKDGDHILPLGASSYLLYDPRPGLPPHVYVPEGAPPVSAMPLDHVDLACYLDSHRVVLLGDKGKAYLWDVTTGEVAPFEPKGVEWGTDSYDFSSCDEGVVQLVSKRQITRVGLSSIETLEIPSITSIAWRGAKPAADTSGATIAAVEATELHGDPTIPEVQEFIAATLVLVDRATGIRQEVDLGENVNYFSVSVSPDGGKVAVTDEYLVRVYDATTATLLYAVPCRSNALYWQSNDTFIYEGDVGPSRLYLANTTKRESQGLSNEASGISISSTSAVVDGYLYFMGFAENPDEPPHGYRVAVP